MDLLLLLDHPIITHRFLHLRMKEVLCLLYAMVEDRLIVAIIIVRITVAIILLLQQQCRPFERELLGLLI